MQVFDNIRDIANRCSAERNNDLVVEGCDVACGVPAVVEGAENFGARGFGADVGAFGVAGYDAGSWSGVGFAVGGGCEVGADVEAVVNG